MGMAKKRQMELGERGFGEVPEAYVCEHCFAEDGLQHFIRNNGSQGVCSYCEGVQRGFWVVTFEEILCHIIQSLKAEEYYDPANSGTPYESAEGGWLVEPYYIIDIIVFGNDSIECVHDDLCDEIVSYLGDIYLLPFFSMPDPEEVYQIEWDKFCELVKHKSRYVFYRANESEEKGGLLYSGMPGEILDLIAEFAEINDMFRIIPEGTQIVRTRLNDTGKYYNAKDLGTPPRKYACFSNRMSPAGIPMFYGAEDSLTAIEETRDSHTKSAIASIGVFQTLRELKILDLVNLPTVPSIYHEERRSNRTPLKFLHNFAEDVSKPVAKDRFEHIEYVPTQVVTEYLKLVYVSDGQKIDGIRYKSSKHREGICYALFVENEDCIDKDQAGHNHSECSAILSLLSVEHLKI